MNGQEIERMLGLIRENMEVNGALRRKEVFRFIADHEEEVLNQLRSTETAAIPTSFGTVHLSLSDLRAAVA